MCSPSTSYFYPRPPRGGRLEHTVVLVCSCVISIHALREEGDHDLFHSPGFVYEFLSTPSARRATRRPSRRTTASGNFYPRPPRGGRPQQRAAAIAVADFYPRPPRGGRLPCRQRCRRLSAISIHALREEGDTIMPTYVEAYVQFLSTPSARRATSTSSSMSSAGLFLSTPSARRATE